jgi:hypothetical protein
VPARSGAEPAAQPGPGHLHQSRPGRHDFVLVRRLGYRLTDVAAALGRDAATISVIVSRLARDLESSGRFAADVARLGRDV